MVPHAQLDGVDAAGRQRNCDRIAANAFAQHGRVHPRPIRHGVDLRPVERIAKTQLDAVTVAETGGERHAVFDHAVRELAGRDRVGIDLLGDQPRARRRPGMRERIQAKATVQDRDRPDEADDDADGDG